MKIIISPAKNMSEKDDLAPAGTPAFTEQAEAIKAVLQSFSYAELKALWKCNDKLTGMNAERVSDMDLSRRQTPAVLAYDGIQYQYMAPGVMETDHFEYLQKHLRILSGFYGILKPFDGIVPYRLEMQAKLSVAGKKDLYDFWGDTLYRALVFDGEHAILNLASKEYSKCIEKYLQPEDVYVTVTFGELANGKVIQKGTLAKMARGEMVRYMAEHRIENFRDIRGFDRLGFSFCEARSDAANYVFLRGNHHEQ